MLEVYNLCPAENGFNWRAFSNDDSYPVAEFETDDIFNGLTIYGAEREIEKLHG